MLSQRVANKQDVQTVADLANQHHLGIDSGVRIINLRLAASLVAGRINPNPATLFYQNHELIAVANLHPDANKQMLFPVIHCAPGCEVQSEILALVLEQASAGFPVFEIQPDVNSLDQELLAAYHQAGFEKIRTFSILRGSLEGPLEPFLKPGQHFHKVDMDNQQDLRVWHATHQDAFQGHFGFRPRGFESWLALVLSDENLDKEGCFILFENQEPMGFVECTFECADQLRGYVASIGVKQAHHGKGLGDALLKKAMHHSKNLGFIEIELNVDTGNTSGALRLYERAGLSPESSWFVLSRYQPPT
tara:strand:- start:80 stop:994 length:915 start_codon:yes stop_codon:yes gene_type:complete